MSTYYYVACLGHQVKTPSIVAVSRVDCPSHLDNEKELLKFLLKHQSCLLKFFSEYDDVSYSYRKDELAD